MKLIQYWPDKIDELLIGSVVKFHDPNLINKMLCYEFDDQGIVLNVENEDSFGILWNNEGEYYKKYSKVEISNNNLYFSYYKVDK